MSLDKLANAEQYKQDIKNGLERLRGAIRMRVHPREQSHFLDVIDRIQEMVLNKSGELEQIQGNIQRTRETTRRLLRTKPMDMVQLLNELDGLEVEVTELFQLLTKGPGSAT